MNKITDILVLQRKNNKYFGIEWDYNKLYISTLKYFTINGEKNRNYKLSVIDQIIKRHKNLTKSEFSILSIKSPKLSKEIKEFVINDCNNLIYNANIMVNILKRRVQEDPKLKKHWDRLETTNFKTNKNYINL